MSENNLLDRLEGLDARFEEVATLITDPAVIADQKRYVRLTKEYRDLERILDATRRYPRHRRRGARALFREAAEPRLGNHRQAPPKGERKRGNEHHRRCAGQERDSAR